ncbi:hypothetical protein ENSA5_23260 [Enhygromyxa salina]|uniref:DUF4331 domain-containing protein n=1 Tax=Enhygromyxa salina TaxID=215803 RepID=A0A2S9YBC0_9BACT|nr:DUF4331 family protein [Enhygromyxa salina]PRQ02399.1 hypothetical protein ENSA5_23260 [Enhygromyxa salina]
MRPTAKHLALAAVLAGAGLVSTFVIAADHDEADTSSFTDDAADIGDLYAFHEGGRVTLILTVDGYKLRGDEPNYDADLIYGFHIDTNGDNVADNDIWARFGQNAAGDWGVEFEGIPGHEGSLIAPVDEATSDPDSGASVFAGLRDDPFFFDLQGFQDTLMTGTVAFNPNRDFVALKNTVALAVEFDHAALASDGVAVWATTGRL